MWAVGGAKRCHTLCALGAPPHSQRLSRNSLFSSFMARCSIHLGTSPKTNVLICEDRAEWWKCGGLALTALYTHHEMKPHRQRQPRHDAREDREGPIQAVCLGTCTFNGPWLATRRSRRETVDVSSRPLRPPALTPKSDVTGGCYVVINWEEFACSDICEQHWEGGRWG